MIKLKPRTTALLALIVIAGIGTAVILLTGTDSNKTPQNTKKAQSIESTTKIDDVTAKLSEYSNKTISVTGRITQFNTSDGASYYISGESSSKDKPASAIKLDFSKSKIDPSGYAQSATNAGGPKSTQKPKVTITGTFKFDAKTGQQPVLIVDSIQ